MKFTMLIFLLVGTGLYSTKTFGQQVDRGTLPVPREKQQLFYLQRDPDANTLVYTLNKVDGKLDDKKPVEVYWIKYEDDGEHEDLTFIQRKLAYGIQHKKLKDGEYEICLTSFKRLPLKLAYCPEARDYRAYASINNQETIVQQIFVRIDGGSMFKPNVDYIEIAGNERKSGKPVRHRIEL